MVRQPLLKLTVVQIMVVLIPILRGSWDFVTRVINYGNYTYV